MLPLAHNSPVAVGKWIYTSHLSAKRRLRCFCSLSPEFWITALCETELHKPPMKEMLPADFLYLWYVFCPFTNPVKSHYTTTHIKTWHKNITSKDFTLNLMNYKNSGPILYGLDFLLGFKLRLEGKHAERKSTWSCMLSSISTKEITLQGVLQRTEATPSAGKGKNSCPLLMKSWF